MRDFETTAKLRAWVRRHPMLPRAHVLAGLGAGAPVAIVAVYLLNEHVLARPMPEYVAIAVGSIAVSVATSLAELIEALRDSLLSRR